MDREYVEDAGKTGRLPNFDIQLRIQCALEEMPLDSVLRIAVATRIPVIAVFYILIEVLALRFVHWRWVPNLLSDDQMADRA
jgi:hypothetical protein